MAAQTVVEIPCESVDDLWSRLAPAGGQFDQQGRAFIFRGQMDSTWRLIPRVFRTEVIERYKRGMMSLGSDHPGQWFFEYVLLHSFMSFCDSAGLVIPGDSMDFRRYFDLSNISNIHAIDNRGWPQDQVVPLMALAQHHGIPTRLLDWSDNAYVACYHASESLARQSFPGEGSIAIFALERTLIAPGITKLKHMRVPGSTSPNLAFQRGSFVLVPNSGHRGEAFTPDVSLESQLPHYSRALLHKFTLPKALGPELLIRCDKYGISGASVFPGYDGAARAALESMLAYNRLAEAK